MGLGSSSAAWLQEALDGFADSLHRNRYLLDLKWCVAAIAHADAWQCLYRASSVTRAPVHTDHSPEIPEVEREAAPTLRRNRVGERASARRASCGHGFTVGHRRPALVTQLMDRCDVAGLARVVRLDTRTLRGACIDALADNGPGCILVDSLAAGVHDASGEEQVALVGGPDGHAFALALALSTHSSSIASLVLTGCHFSAAGLSALMWACAEGSTLRHLRCAVVSARTSPALLRVSPPLRHRPAPRSVRPPDGFGAATPLTQLWRKDDVTGLAQLLSRTAHLETLRCACSTRMPRTRADPTHRGLQPAR